MAVDSFERILKYPKPIISRNASESFFPKREGIYSQWLLDNNGLYTYCRYYPAFVQLAAVANNPDEQTTRDLVLRHAPDTFTGLAEFARLLPDDRSLRDRWQWLDYIFSNLHGDDYFVMPKETIPQRTMFRTCQVLAFSKI